MVVVALYHSLPILFGEINKAVSGNQPHWNWQDTTSSSIYERSRSRKTVRYVCLRIATSRSYMAVSQNCVWNVPRCSGRMERRGFVTVLVPDLWGVMKYKLYIHMYIYIYIYTYCKYVCNIHLRDMLVKATHAGCRSFSLLICTYLHDMLAVHLFNAGLPCMASSRALARTQPVASVIHRLPCEAVHSASDLYVRTCHLFTREWVRGGTGLVRVWNGYGTVWNGVWNETAHSSTAATTQHIYLSTTQRIFIKIGRLERE